MSNQIATDSKDSRLLEVKGLKKHCPVRGGMIKKGVGTVKAQAIVDYRASNGLFSNPEQIIMVRGIGDSTFEKNKVDILIK